MISNTNPWFEAFVVYLREYPYVFFVGAIKVFFIIKNYILILIHMIKLLKSTRHVGLGVLFKIFFNNHTILYQILSSSEHPSGKSFNRKTKPKMWETSFETHQTSGCSGVN